MLFSKKKINYSYLLMLSGVVCPWPLIGCVYFCSFKIDATCKDRPGNPLPPIIIIELSIYY